MAESAFVVFVPEAEPVVAALRARWDPSAALGVAAHVTLLMPFMPPERIGNEVLRRARRSLGAIAAFEFRLARVARFPAAAYLAPEPVEPFVALTRSLVGAFPAYPPYRGEHGTSIIPHLTVAHGSTPDAEFAERELAAALRTFGPIHARCRNVALIENGSGRWRPLHVFELPGTDPAG